jgi:hypothetical protein
VAFAAIVDPATSPYHAEVDVRIGVTYSAKELDLEVPEGTSAEDLRKQVESALAEDDNVLWLMDRKGRQIGVPASKVAYVEIGSPHEERRIGFGGG